MNIAEQILLQHEMMKAARCWAGYEPVPGKAPYSEGSCRPKGNKKKEKKQEKQSAQSVFPGFEERKQLGQSAMGKLMGKKPVVSPVVQPAAKPIQPVAKKAAEECCAASMPEHTATEPTKQIKPKPAVVSNDKKVITGDLQAAIKKAVAGEGKGEEKYEPKGQKARLGQSVFTHVEKKDEEELDGAKPSHEGSKHIKVTREEPEESEDLRPEAVFPDTRAYSS